MNLRVLALFLLLTMSLGGCASILNRSYASESNHAQVSNEEQNPDVLRAEDYESIVTAFLYLVSQRVEEGVIRVYEYTDGEVLKKDLDAAEFEALKLDPLGAYAVEYMRRPTLNPVVSYYEVEFKIIYRRSWEQISGVVSVTGVSAILGELQESLLQFQEETVLRISYFDPEMTKEDVVGMVQEAYYNVPEAAFGMPEIEVHLYPDANTLADLKRKNGSGGSPEEEIVIGQQRLVEILLTYYENELDLREKRDDLLERCAQLLEGLPQGAEESLVMAMLPVLQGGIQYVPEEGADLATAYGALIEGRANSEGMALATALLCREAGLQCKVLQGMKDGTPHFWNTVQIEGRRYHLDISQGEASLLEDADMWAAGYTWQADMPAGQSLFLPEDGGAFE